MVDACVLLDVFNDDGQWYQWSADKLIELSKTHNLVINTVIFTELALNFDSCKELELTLSQMGIRILDIPLTVAFNASKIFKKFRKNRGSKTAAMPDFYIAAHAAYLKIPLATRDSSRFKAYQPGLVLIYPQ